MDAAMDAMDAEGADNAIIMRIKFARVALRKLEEDRAQPQVLVPSFIFQCNVFCVRCFSLQRSTYRIMILCS